MEQAVLSDEISVILDELRMFRSHYANGAEVYWAEDRMLELLALQANLPATDQHPYLWEDFVPELPFREQPRLQTIFEHKFDAQRKRHEHLRTKIDFNSLRPLGDVTVVTVCRPDTMPEARYKEWLEDVVEQNELFDDFVLKCFKEAPYLDHRRVANVLPRIRATPYRATDWYEYGAQCMMTLLYLLHTLPLGMDPSPFERLLDACMAEGLKRMRSPRGLFDYLLPMGRAFPQPDVYNLFPIICHQIELRWPAVPPQAGLATDRR